MKRRKRTNTNSTKIQQKYANQSYAGKSILAKKDTRLGIQGKFFWITVTVLFIGCVVYIWILSRDLPPLTKLENIDPALATHIYSEDGEIIDSFHRQNRTIAPYHKFPKHLVQALLATEDRRFFNHWGVDILSLMRAVLFSVVKFDRAKGTSTLTMQLARNLNIGFGLERTWQRKIKEILTSIQIERTYSKQEIIEMYLNINFFGSNSYGVQSAAQTFFSKDVEYLTVEESALLIGSLKGQSLYNPLSNPDRSISRRNIVLNSMFEVGDLKKEEYDSLTSLPLTLHPASEQSKIAPYFTEYVRQQLNQLQDSLNINIYEDGLRVYTTLNTKIQKYVDQAIEEKMPAFQERIRNKSAMQRLKTGMADTAFSDSLFNELTTVQIAFICLDPHNGHILAMVGGRDFEKSQYNRAVQAPRQPGSAFKPFVYTVAIDNGYTPTDEFLNQPFVLINDDGTRWTPHNYDNTVSGLMTLRQGLRGSINNIAIRLIQEVGPGEVAKYAKRMGITTNIRPVPSLALGSSEVYLIELVSAYGIFSNNGVLVKPLSILKIEDRTGNIIYQNRSPQREVLNKETASIMNDLLQDVVNKGTGSALRLEYQFYIPAGGKTGTTNDYTDAWFVGFTPHIAAGVWVGFDDPTLSLGNAETGARAALPFWGQFIKTVYDSLAFPPAEFEASANVVTLKVCKETKKLVTPYCPNPIEELFIIKYAPTETCNIHIGVESVRRERRRRF